MQNFATLDHGTVQERVRVVLVDAFGTLVKAPCLNLSALLPASLTSCLSGAQLDVVAQGLPWPLLCRPDGDVLSAARGVWLTQSIGSLAELARAYADAGLACNDVESRLPVAQCLFERACAGTELADGARQWLDSAHHYCEDVVVTTNASSLQLPVLRRLFGPDQKLAVSGLVGFKKPHFRLFEAALGLCGRPVAPHQALMLGDDFFSDTVGAAAAGLASVLLVKPNEDALTADQFAVARELLGLARLSAGVATRETMEPASKERTEAVRIVRDLEEARVLLFVNGSPT